MRIPFTKMHGAGNDFIVIDDRDGIFPLGDRAFMTRICDRRTGIGSDGILLLQASDKADFRMRFINPDGQEVEMCGNGARCIARFACDRANIPQTMKMETVAGTVHAELVEEQVRVGLTAPVDLQLDLDIGLPRPVDFVNTGVPHAVCWVDDVRQADVQSVGAAVRYHDCFRPEGTNANFARTEADGSLTVRTYERGVEGETLACGTGAAAAALLAVERGWTTMPVTVHCASGYDLVIDSGESGITLLGGACYVFTGEVNHGNRL